MSSLLYNDYPLRTNVVTSRVRHMHRLIIDCGHSGAPSCAPYIFKSFMWDDADMEDV